MKTKMKYLVGMALFLFIAMGVNAQQQTPAPIPTQTVPAGATKSYSVTAHTGYNQTWSIDGAATSNILTPSGNSANVQWLSPGTYRLRLVEENASNVGCSPYNNLIDVTVLGAYLKLNSLASSGCSDLPESLTLTFSSDAAGTVAAVASQYPLTVNYDVKIEATDGSFTTASRQAIINDAAGLALPITVTDRADRTDWDPSYTVTVTITSATAANSFAVTVDAANDEHVNTVYDKPEQNAIVPAP